MYRDPARIRERVIKVRLSREEDALLEALADYTGEQKAVLIRELLLEAARAVLEPKSDAAQCGLEGARQGVRG
jgi:predicted DNA-binding protein